MTVSDPDSETFVDLFDDAVRDYSDRTLLDFDGQQSTYGQVEDRSDAIAAGLDALGVDSGDHVVVILPNSEAMVSVITGLPKCGAVPAFVNVGMKGDALGHLLSTADGDVAIVDETVLDGYESTVSDLQNPPSTLLVRSSEDGSSSPEPSHDSFEGTLDELISRHRDREPPSLDKVRPADTFELIHTAGTTGNPKWCELSHRAVLQTPRGFADVMDIDSDDVLYDPLPLYHSNAQWFALFTAIVSGGSFATAESFSASRFLDRVRHCGATAAVLHFPVVDILDKRLSEDDYLENGIEVMFPPDRDLLELLDVGVGVSLYGTTEVGCTHAARFERPFDESVPEGVPLSQVAGTPLNENREIQLVDARDVPVEEGEIGEIVVRPAVPGTIFKGYYGMPAETVATIENLWYHTDDLGRVDEQGRLHFKGRKGDSIRVRGSFVNVALVEDALRDHPDVADAAIVGVPAEIGDEEIKAFVTTTTEGEVAPEELVRRVENELPSSMVPRYVEYIDEFPRTAGTKKIRKWALSTELTGEEVDRHAEGGDDS